MTEEDLNIYYRTDLKLSVDPNDKQLMGSSILEPSHKSPLVPTSKWNGLANQVLRNFCYNATLWRGSFDY